MTARITILVLFVLTLAAPVVLQGGRTAADPDARPLIIITPHNEQIRHEFGLAFAAWHRETYDEPAVIRWSVPGGTSEIRRMLIAQYEGAIEDGREPGGNADMVFGGGSYEHGELKKGVTATAPDGTEQTVSISAPVEFGAARLESIYGAENLIGDAPLYDPDGHWFGTAVSGFGILWNRDALADAFGTVTGSADAPPDPTTWADLAAPELLGWVALVNPAQSGSITTAFDAILQREGWTRGWQILRRAAANSRYFSASSLKPPTDVTQGDAAMGICIDFYGRYQAQAMVEAGDPDRLGYVDPANATVIDPDPISMLRGAPDPELARRFIEFCLTDRAQALWQFPARNRRGAGSSADQDPAAGAGEGSADGVADGLGPDRFELRRLPIRRSFYAEYSERMIDQARPYAIASAVDQPNRAIRSFIAPIFAAMAMDTHADLVAAWEAIIRHPAYPHGGDPDPRAAFGRVVTAADVDDPELKAMLAAFDAMPELPQPEGPALSIVGPEHLADLKAGWLRGGFEGSGLWVADEDPAGAMRRLAARFFRDRYRTIAASGQ